MTGISYLKPTENYWAFDIEGDLIPTTKIWCAVAINILSGETHKLVGEDSVRAWLGDNPDAVLVGHNLIGYDAPTCNRVLGCNIPISRVIDTFLLSQLYSPGLRGGHSLDSWGSRLRYGKYEFSDFSHYSERMLDYCERDTELTRRLYLTLCNLIERAGISEKAIKLEHESWALIQIQKRNGFAFDIKRAHELYAELRAIENKLRDEIYEYWPPELKLVYHYKSATKRDGTPTKAFERHSEEYEKLEVLDDGSYNAYDYIAFNIGSPPQRVEKLLELGWKPREFTPITDKGGGGNPKVTDSGELVPSLVEFMEENDKPEIKLIARWIDINARANMINNWIDNYNENTGCIHGNLWLAGTLRYRHSNPNSANIPAVRLNKEETEPLFGLDGSFTYEARDLWTVRDPDNRVLVGVDAKGIQLRILAEYLQNAKFTEAVLSGDPHAANKENWGLPTRPLTKTITYATLMGAGDKKVADEAKITLHEAKEVKGLFFAAVPELPRLIRRLKSELKRTGRITLCDGSRIEVPSDHMVIPYLLQGDESRIMRAASVRTFKECVRRSLDVLKVGDIHDEWQNDVLEVHSSEFMLDVLPLAFAHSGKFHGYSIPIECDAKKGMTWAETH